MGAAEWVEVQVPDEWVTKGQTRPALVLRTNEEPHPDAERAKAGETVRTYDLVTFHHPEDRQGSEFGSMLRVPAERVQGGASSSSAPPPAEGKPNPAPPPPGFANVPDNFYGPQPPPPGRTPSGEGRPAFGGLRAGAQEHA